MCGAHGFFFFFLRFVSNLFACWLLFLRFQGMIRMKGVGQGVSEVIGSGSCSGI